MPVANILRSLASRAVLPLEFVTGFRCAAGSRRTADAG